MIQQGKKSTTSQEARRGLSIEKLYGLITLLCALVHTIYLAIFITSKLNILCAFECVNIIAYMLLGFAVQNRMFPLMLSVLHMGVFSTFAVGTIMFGWAYGFEFVLLCILILEEHFMYRNRNTPHLLRAAGVILLLVVGIVSGYYTPPYAEALVLWQRNVLFVTNIVVFAVGILACAIIGGQSNSVAVMILEEKANYLQRLAETDPLTNLLNRRSMLTRLETAIEHSSQSGEPLCVVMCDIDDFKTINDTYGHSSGDFVLRMLAETITEYLGDNDAVCRWGGEEILILLENTSLAQAKEIVNGLRRAVETAPFVYCGRILSITMTMGITQCWEGATVPELIAQADMLMYAGKRRGKNCVVPSR